MLGGLPLLGRARMTWALTHPYLTCFLAYCVLHVIGVDGVRDVLKSKADVKRTEAIFNRGESK